MVALNDAITPDDIARAEAGGVTHIMTQPWWFYDGPDATSTRRSTRCRARTSCRVDLRGLTVGYSDSPRKTIAGVIVLSMESSTEESRSSPAPAAESVGIAHALLAEGRPSSDAARRTGRTPGPTTTPIGRAAVHSGCATRAMSRPSTPSCSASSTPTAASTSQNNAGGTVPHPARRGRPRVGPEDPGRPRGRRLRAHRPVPRLRRPDESDQPDVVRDPRRKWQMKTQEGTGSIVNISSGAGHRRGTDPRLPTARPNRASTT